MKQKFAEKFKFNIENHELVALGRYLKDDEIIEKFIGKEMPSLVKRQERNTICIAICKGQNYDIRFFNDKDTDVSDFPQNINLTNIPIFHMNEYEFTTILGST